MEKLTPTGFASATAREDKGSGKARKPDRAPRQVPRPVRRPTAVRTKDWRATIDSDDHYVYAMAL